MYLTFDRKTGELLGFSDILGYESNVNSDNIVYMDDHIVIGKYFINDIKTEFTTVHVSLFLFAVEFLILFN